MTQKFRLSAVIPAYNEGPRIAAVLEVVLRTEMIDEVIVIDDGSKDDTARRAERYAAAHPQLKVLRQVQNAGKSKAVSRGVAEARGTHVLLLDSDLIGLTPADIAALVAPVKALQADVSISLRGNAPAPWRWIGLDYISGERVVPREMLARRHDDIAALTGFGLEVFMNRFWLRDKCRIAVVSWPGVASPFKKDKQGLWSGMLADARMLRDMLSTVSPVAIAKQITQMRRQRV